MEDVGVEIQEARDDLVARRDEGVVGKVAGAENAAQDSSLLLDDSAQPKQHLLADRQRGQQVAPDLQRRPHGFDSRLALTDQTEQALQLGLCEVRTRPFAIELQLADEFAVLDRGVCGGVPQRDRRRSAARQGPEPDCPKQVGDMIGVHNLDQQRLAELAVGPELGTGELVARILHPLADLGGQGPALGRREGGDVGADLQHLAEEAGSVEVREQGLQIGPEDGPGQVERARDPDFEEVSSEMDAPGLGNLQQRQPTVQTL